MPQFQFDATKVEPDAGRMGVIPKGWYSLVMTKSDFEATQSGGTYINGQFQVTEGPYKGAVVFHMFQIKNDNPKTVEIAHKQLSALSHAVNRLQWSQTEMLHNIPFKGRLGIDPAQNGYEEKNKITMFTTYNDPKAVNKEEAPQQQKSVAPPPVQPAYQPPPVQQPQFAPAPQPASYPQAQQPLPPNTYQHPPAQPVAGVAPPAQWTPPNIPQPWEQPQQAPMQQPPAQQPPAWNGGQPAPQQQYTPPPQVADPNGYPAGYQSAPPPSQQGYVQPPMDPAQAAMYAAPAASTPAAAPDIPPWIQQGQPQ